MKMRPFVGTLSGLRPAWGEDYGRVLQMRKFIYALLVGAFLVLGAGAAHADYNSVGGSVQSGGSVTDGSTQTFVAEGFKVGTSVDFILHSDPINLGSATADSSGTATLTATIPSNA